MAWYRVGSITVTNGSTTVTGSGTAWIANAGVGEALYAPDGRLYEIASISSDTTMTLASAYLGSNQSGQAYVIVPSQSYIRDLAAQAADLVNNYSTIYNTVGQGKFPDGTLAAPSIRFSDDLDTGFYRSASNEVTFVAGGVAQFKYNSSGLTLLNGSQSFTTIDATTLEVTNIKAKDGTAAIAIADSTGVATISANPVFSGGTANGVAYLNASKVLTTGSALTFDGTNLLNAQNSTSPIGLRLSNANAGTSAGTRVLFEYAGSPTGYVGNQFDGSDFNTQYMANQSHIWLRGTTEQMRLTSTGLGIGTSSPANKLDVVGSSSRILTRSTTAASNADVRYTATNADWVVGVNSVSGVGEFAWYSVTASAERLRLDASGNLGLGVTPSAWNSGQAVFQNKGGALSSGADSEIYLGQNIYYGGSPVVDRYVNNGFATSFGQSYGTFTWRVAPSGTAGNAISWTQAMTLDASGNLGIGKTSPAARLDVNGNTLINALGNGSTALLVQDTVGTGVNQSFDVDISKGGGAYSYMRFRLGNEDIITWGFTLSTYANLLTLNSPFGEVAFKTNGSERMRIDSSGNVLVGTTSSSPAGTTSQFVNQWFGGAKWGASFDQTDSSATAYTHINFSTNGTTVGNINANNTTTTYATSSDYRLKENIQPIQNALDVVAQLNPVTYKWKADGSDGQGFIAHELQAVVPDAVTGEKDAVDADGNPIYQGVDTSFLVATLTKAIQEQQDIINSLKARLDAAGL